MRFRSLNDINRYYNNHCLHSRRSLIFIPVFLLVCTICTAQAQEKNFQMKKFCYIYWKNILENNPCITNDPHSQIHSPVAIAKSPKSCSVLQDFEQWGRSDGRTDEQTDMCRVKKVIASDLDCGSAKWINNDMSWKNVLIFLMLLVYNPCTTSIQFNAVDGFFNVLFPIQIFLPEIYERIEAWFNDT